MDDRIKVQEGTVLTVPNRHIEMCGKPPELKAEGRYTAYFENDYGEQTVFQYDHEAKRGTLWHGDYSWEQPVPVMGGGTTLILSEEERKWLRFVWQVATRYETKEFQLRSSLGLVKAYQAIYDNLLSRPEFVDDDWMQRSFSKTKKRLEKEEKAILGGLEKLKAVEDVERFLHEDEDKL